jgi:Cofactor assembly of complex C subunit B, CCB2/CCB4
VILEGEELDEPEFFPVNNVIMADRPMLDPATLTWALESLLVATPAKSVVVLTRRESSGNDNGTDGWAVHCRAGVVPSRPKSNDPAEAASVPDASPIVNRVGSPGNTKETYLPTLQALPGRFEFTYLPPNCQLALLLPVPPPGVDIGEGDNISHNKVLVLGSGTAKSFSPRDIAWSRVVAERIGDTYTYKST